MKRLSALFLIICLMFPFVSYASDPDNIDLKGKWDDDTERMISPSQPTLSIHGSMLVVQFVTGIDNLTVCVKNWKGETIHESTLSGSTGEYVSIPLAQTQAGIYYVLLTHRRGWLMGEFDIQ